MAKFKIVQNRIFKCTFIIKQSGTTDPIQLSMSDTGTFTLSTYGIDPQVLLSKVPMALGTSEDNANGKMFLTLTADQTKDLPSNIQFGEDGFPVAPTCQALLDVSTATEGTIYAQVPQIYVVDIGE